jgi:hypothetical protein
MPAISYTDWSGGLDRRLPQTVQEANRLWVLRNAFITNGKKIKKRPALRKLASGLTGSFGLKAIGGRLKIFVDKGAAFVPPVYCDKVELDIPGWSAGTLDRIHYADVFSGFAFVVARYSDDQVAHHYVDANPSTVITDANNPRSISVTKAASRIFATGGEVVRYCKAGDPRDWTTASDAGFLPASLQQETNTDVIAVGTFQNALVVFFSESGQIWNVAVDPSANTLSKRFYGVGVDAAPLSLASFASDLVFLSPYGFRSMTVQAQTDRIDDTDVGVPIDDLVKPDIATAAAFADPTQTFGVWIPEFGQYWCVMDAGTTSKVWAYTFSRSSKIACWSEYLLPVKVAAITTLGGKVYLRTVDDLYEVSATQYTDDGSLVQVEVQMAFQDAKSPGVDKQVFGGDWVVQGSPDISFKYDPRDTSKETVAQRITGDTRPGEVIPVEVVAPAIAPVFRHALDEAFELDAVTLYYHLLGL